MIWLIVWFIVEGHVMSIDIPQCEPHIIKGIEKFWNGRPPTNVIDQIKEDSPWGIVYASPGTFPVGTKAVNIYHNRIQIVPRQGGSVETPVNWEESNGILTDGTVQWHVLLCDVMTFAFYKCDTKGKAKSKHLAGISIALGPPGGIPDEAKTTALDAKETFRKLGIHLDIDYDFHY